MKLHLWYFKLTAMRYASVRGTWRYVLRFSFPLWRKTGTHYDPIMDEETHRRVWVGRVFELDWSRSSWPSVSSNWWTA